MEGVTGRRVFKDCAGQTEERLVGWIINIFPYVAKKFESDLNSPRHVLHGSGNQTHEFSD